MQSLRSRIIIGLIRNRHLFKLRLKPEVVDKSFSVEEFRKNVDEVSRKTSRMPKGIEVVPAKVHDMYAEWIIPKDAPDKKVIMYVHGGGFISGSCLTHRMHVSKFAKGSGIKALLFDYRLAPEHPYPAAVEDCVTAYLWLLEQGYLPSDIVLCGESAGGTLTLATLVALRDKGVALPAGGVAISPVTDLTCSAKSFITNSRKDIAPINSWSVWTGYYIGDNDPGLPWLSPLKADLAGLPPILLCVGSSEIHLDDTVNFANKAKEQGTEAVLMV
ncbi:MAG TPA: alpha/beta hydrolase, partial [Bacillota bacterium]|nr:alpha/beta hydrolase [Bacillota bacterium]